jgi:thiol-disulfide isomerase/thioredoxin
LLAQETVKEYGERARFAVQDFGASPLAERFGIDKYPAIIVDDALVARPEDFYAWGGAGKGRYIPWSELENRREFQRDLSRMIDIRLAGGDVHAAAGDRPAGGAMLPSLTLTDLAGRTIRTADLRGKPVFVEFWAPWCPPCLETMRWLKTIDTSRVNVVLIAVESERAQVEKLVAEVQPPGRVVIGSAETIEAFGGLPAIPAMFVAAPDGRITRTFLGAPPRLHEEITAALQAAASRPEKRQS